MKTTLVVAGIAAVLVLLRRRSGWQPTAGDIRQAPFFLVLLGGAGIVIAVSTGNWLYLGLIGLAAVIGGIRYVAYRRTGRWR